MFGIGTSELLVVAVIALLLFSPRELPKIVRSVSQFWASLRRTADEFRDAIMQEEAMQDLKEAVDGTKRQLRDAEGAARRELMKARMEMRRAENKLVKVARERERIEREAEAPEGDGEAGASGAKDSNPTVEGQPAAAETAALAPAGTVAAGTSATGAGASTSAAPEAPKSVDPRHAGASAAAPKSVDPRHASSADAGSGPDGKPPANQGAA